MAYYWRCAFCGWLVRETGIVPVRARFPEEEIAMTEHTLEVHQLDRELLSQAYRPQRTTWVLPDGRVWMERLER